MSDYNIEDFLNLFPKGREKIRFTQQVILTDIKNELDRGTKYIIAEAPTGTGKSDTAVHLALYKRGGTILTTQKILQEQYAKEFPFVQSVKGENEFPCHQENDKKQCDEGICKFPNGKFCRHYVSQGQIEITREGTKLELVELREHSKKTSNNLGECDYYLQRRMGEKASFAIYNYAKYLSSYLADASTVNDAQRELLICDEAHSLEEQLANHMALKLSTEYATKVKNEECKNSIIRLCGDWEEIEKKKFNDQISEESFEEEANQFITKTSRIAGKLIPDYDKRITAIVEEIADGLREKQTKITDFDFEKDYDKFLPGHKRFAKLQTELDKLRRIRKDLTDILEITINDYVFGGIEQTKKTYQHVISIKPIDVSSSAKKLFDKFKHVIFFSSTIDEEYFQKELGITNSFYKRYSSEFPPENGKILKKYKMKLSVKNKEGVWKEGIKEIEAELSRHKDEKGLILVSSFHYQNEIWKRLSPSNQKRVKRISEKQTRDEFIEQHRKANDNSVLISPSLWEGVDLGDDECRFQIIAKAPYLNLGDLRVKKKKDDPDFGSKWYKTYSLHRLIQGCGRGIRHKDDWATTYLVDTNCDDLLSYNSPKQFKDRFDAKDTLQKNYKAYEDKELHKILGSEFDPAELNKDQRKGVEANPKEAVLIQAGPGTGKTRMIVERVKHLILKKGVDPSKILCLTFTRIAMEEMQRRLVDDDEELNVMNKDFSGENIKTFHKLGLYILRRNQSTALEVMEDYEKKKLVSRIINRKNLVEIKDSEVSDVSMGIKAHKGEGIPPQKIRKNAEKMGAGKTRVRWLEFADVYEEYNTMLKQKKGIIDFEDMLQKSLDILEDDKEVLENYRKEWQYVLVDEYQDNNYLQTKLAQKIAPEGRITVVGDTNQCIFTFQGANFRNFEIFKDVYRGNCGEYPISQNYRSTQKIVNIAKKLIPNTELMTTNEVGSNISVCQVKNEEDQGKFIIKKIREHINTRISRLRKEDSEYLLSYRDFQIIGRINATLDMIEKQLVDQCIPFVARDKPNTEVLNQIGNALTEFMMQEILNDETKLDDLIEKLGKKIASESENRKYYESLRNLAEDFVRIHKGDTIDSFKKYLKDDNTNFVVLKTVHKSKGTEKPIVFIAGVNQGLFPMTKPENIYSIPNELRHYPHQNSGIGKTEEEKRIFFVALTRAKNLIYVTCAEKRRWNNKPTDTRVSDFLNKLDYVDNPDIDFEIEPENGSTY